jgi:hypothetical protein
MGHNHPGSVPAPRNAVLVGQSPPRKWNRDARQQGAPSRPFRRPHSVRCRARWKRRLRSREGAKLAKENSLFFLTCLGALRASVSLAHHRPNPSRDCEGAVAPGAGAFASQLNTSRLPKDRSIRTTYAATSDAPRRLRCGACAATSAKKAPGSSGASRISESRPIRTATRLPSTGPSELSPTNVMAA